LPTLSNCLPSCGHRQQDVHIRHLFGHANMITLSQNYIFDGLLRQVIMISWAQSLDQIHSFTVWEGPVLRSLSSEACPQKPVLRSLSSEACPQKPVLRSLSSDRDKMTIHRILRRHASAVTIARDQPTSLKVLSKSRYSHFYCDCT
jgi:hypothetical protein